MMRKAWWLMAAATVAGAAWALDPPRPAPATSQAAAGEQPAPAAAPVAVPAPAAQEPAEPQADTTAVPPPPETQRTGPTPQRFNPTEEVRADFPVSFPSDI